MGVKKSMSDLCVPFFGEGLFLSEGPICSLEEALSSIKFSRCSLIALKRLGVGVIPMTSCGAYATPRGWALPPCGAALSLVVPPLGGSVLLEGSPVAPLVVFGL